MFWLKRPILPGDYLTHLVSKKGEKRDQGIGYLEDGTIVVVEGAGSMVGKHVEIAIKNVRFASTGRVVFGEVRDEEN